MPESPAQFLRRAVGATDEQGRLPMPPVDDWDTFPFEGEIVVRPLIDSIAEERSRHGEGGVDCWRCENGDEAAIWSDDRWLVTSLPNPSGLPVIVLLFPREHLDIHDLPPQLQTELGPMLVRVEAAVQSVGEIGRVHVCRWGDGSAHLHWWFMARPAGIPQLRGSFAAIWDDILPPMPEDVWRENLAIVADSLARDGGRAH